MASPRKSFCYDDDPRGLSYLEEDERYARMSEKEVLQKFHAVSPYIAYDMLESSLHMFIL